MKKHSTLFIGLDTQKDSIAVAYATDSRTEPVTYLGAIGTFSSDRKICPRPLWKKPGMPKFGSAGGIEH